jgi:hypothetical protein
MDKTTEEYMRPMSCSHSAGQQTQVRESHQIEYAAGMYSNPAWCTSGHSCKQTLPQPLRQDVGFLQLTPPPPSAVLTVRHMQTSSDRQADSYSVTGYSRKASAVQWCSGLGRACRYLKCEWSYSHKCKQLYGAASFLRN